jgi:hypothetical protein
MLLMLLNSAIIASLLPGVLAGLAAAASHCAAKPDANATAMQAVLGYCCNPSGGKVDCKPINPGGAHYMPNTVRDHTNYAMDAYYQANMASHHIKYLTCSFGGLAMMTPPPIGYFYLSGGAVGAPGQLAPSTPAGYGIGQAIVMPQNSSVTFRRRLLYFVSNSPYKKRPYTKRRLDDSPYKRYEAASESLIKF